MYKPLAILFKIVICLLPAVSLADNQRSSTLRIGYIGSLTNFAASYGAAVLRGVELAIAEARQAGQAIDLIVEDDQSRTERTVNAYRSIRAKGKLDGLVTGTWWANGIVKIVERDGIPFLSNETLFVNDTILAPNYFILQGDVGDWIDAFGPLVDKLGLKRGAMIRFNSGFALRLEERMRNLFSTPAREFLASLEYSEIQSLDALTLATKLKQLHPDVVYIDAEPGTLATLVRKIRGVGLNSTPLLASSVTRDAIEQGLLDIKQAGPIYYTNRATLGQDFQGRYLKHFAEEPKLNADLGYYSIKLLLAALADPKPVNALRNGLSVAGMEFKFDHRNVLTNNRLEVWSCNQGPCRLVSF